MTGRRKGPTLDKPPAVGFARYICPECGAFLDWNESVGLTGVACEGTGVKAHTRGLVQMKRQELTLK